MFARGAPLFCLALVTGCATASVAENDGDGGTDVDAPPGTIDARTDGTPPPIDAPLPIDARIIDGPPAPQTITLSQSSSTAITALNSVACANNTSGATRENSYYRVFRLSDFGVSTAFTAQRVDVGIEEADSLTGTQTIQVRLYTLNGGFTLPNLTAIAGQTVTIANTALSTTQVTLAPAGVAPAGSTVVVEVFSPDGNTNGNIFYPGSNAAAETGPSYIRAPDCGAAQPATFASLSQPQVHLVLTVTGTY